MFLQASLSTLRAFPSSSGGKTSSLRPSKTVKKLSKKPKRDNKANMYADVVVSAEITEHIRGLSQLIRWQDVFKLVYDRTYQIEVLQDRTGPNQTGPAIGPGSNMNADIIVSARFMEHIKGLSQLIRWQDFITSSASIKTLRRTVTKSPEKEFQNDLIYFLLRKLSLIIETLFYLL